MNAVPFICPGCGELVIATSPPRSAVTLPTHPDRSNPRLPCQVGVVPTMDTYLNYVQRRA